MCLCTRVCVRMCACSVSVCTLFFEEDQVYKNVRLQITKNLRTLLKTQEGFILQKIKNIRLKILKIYEHFFFRDFFNQLFFVNRQTLSFLYNKSCFSLYGIYFSTFFDLDSFKMFKSASLLFH